MKFKAAKQQMHGLQRDKDCTQASSDSLNCFQHQKKPLSLQRPRAVFQHCCNCTQRFRQAKELLCSPSKSDSCTLTNEIAPTLHK